MWPYVRQQHSSSDWHWWCPKSPSALQQVIKQAYTLLDHVYVIKMFPGVLRIGIPLNVVLNFPLSHYSLHLYVNSFQNWALRWKCPGSCFPYKRPFPQYMSFLIHLSCPWPRIKNFKFWNSNEVVASLLQANVCFIFKMLPAFLGFRFQYRSELLFHKSSNLLFCSWDQGQQNSGVAVKYPPAQRVYLVPGTKVGLWKSLFFSFLPAMQSSLTPFTQSLNTPKILPHASSTQPRPAPFTFVGYRWRGVGAFVASTDMLLGGGEVPPPGSRCELEGWGALLQAAGCVLSQHSGGWMFTAPRDLAEGTCHALTSRVSKGGHWVVLFGVGVLVAEKCFSKPSGYKPSGRLLERQSPAFLVPGMGFVEDSFPTDWAGAGHGLGMIQAHHICCTLYF